MKRIIFTGVTIAVAVMLFSMMTSCGNAPFGSAGPTGIDTIAKLPRLPMITTDSSLIPVLTSPANQATGVPAKKAVVFAWNPVTGASGYRFVLSANTRIADPIIDDSTLTGADTSDTITVSLSYGTPYYWVVNAKNHDGKMAWSTIGSFTTESDPLVKLQNDYVGQKFGMFIHFGMSTFARYNFPSPGGEWELGGEDENLFNPTSLNVGQWADVAKSAHCKYVVVTAKHHGGFCLWPSNGPWSMKPHSIAQSAWYQQNGNRDILKEFVDSVRSRGMEPGFYYSVRDGTNPPTLPMVLGQLTELLTNYGDIKVLWFDGWGWYVGYFQIPYTPVASLVHELNAKLGHHTIISENNHQKALWNTEIVQYEIPIDGPPLSGNTLPSEGNEPLRIDDCWFWHPMNNSSKSTKFVLDRISSANAVNATYLLDLTPDTTGLIPQYQVQAMNDIGATGVQQGVIQP